MKQKSNSVPVYVLHGWSNETKDWGLFLKSLSKQGVKAELLNIPGLTTDLKKAWTLDDFVDWFDKQTREGRFSLIAHSFGGRIGIRYDVKHPNRVKKLVLIDSAGIRPTGIGARIKRSSFKALASVGKKFTSSEKLRKLLYKAAREKDYHDADKIMRETMASIVSDDQRDELPYVKADTLIIWGQKDKVTPLSDARLMNKQITGSQLVIVPKARHSPQFTHHKQVAEHVAKFLRG